MIKEVWQLGKDGNIYLDENVTGDDKTLVAAFTNDVLREDAFLMSQAPGLWNFLQDVADALARSHNGNYTDAWKVHEVYQTITSVLEELDEAYKEHYNAQTRTTIRKIRR